LDTTECLPLSFFWEVPSVSPFARSQKRPTYETKETHLIDKRDLPNRGAESKRGQEMGQECCRERFGRAEGGKGERERWRKGNKVRQEKRPADARSFVGF
jgi:hypothetical protein